VSIKYKSNKQTLNDNISISMDEGCNMKYTIILSGISNDFLDPVTLERKINTRLLNINLHIFPTKQHTEFKKQFGSTQDTERFTMKFKEKDFRPITKMNLPEEKQNETQKSVTNTTFTCVIKRVPTNMEANELELYLKQKGLPITNVTRIKNDRGPLPLLRVFTRDPNIVSNFITNGISIGYNSCRVEESKTRGSM